MAAGAGLVFAVGGDGTVRACASALAGTGIRLAIIPRGTANLAAHALGIPHRLEAALAAGFGGHETLLDLGMAEDAGFVTMFTTMAGIGLDAAVVGATRRQPKLRFGWLAYAGAGLGHLHGTPSHFTVTLDGAEILHRPVHGSRPPWRRTYLRSSRSRRYATRHRQRTPTGPPSWQRPRR